MFNREFEAFLLEQVRRESAMYFGIMIAFGGCGAACIVMAVAAPIVYGTGWLGISLKLLLVALIFAGGCCGSSFMVRKGREAADEMAYGLEHPECSIPEDYMDETKDARDRVCRNLRSIRGLIISYGIIAVMLWAVTALMAMLGGIGTPDYSLMFLLVACVTFAMALGLSILAIAYVLDLPEARKYRKLIEDSENGGSGEASEEREDSENGEAGGNNETGKECEAGGYNEAGENGESGE